MMKRLTRQVLPATLVSVLRRRYRQWRNRLRLYFAVRDDRQVFLRGSGLLRLDTHRASLEANLIKAYHRIEKGLALAEPRPGFGRDAVDLLVIEGERYLRDFGPGRTLQRVVNTLDEYMRFNRQHGVELADLAQRVDRLRLGCAVLAPCAEGGTLAVHRDTILAAARLDLTDFFQQRYSVRQFSGEAVSPGLVDAAVRMAQKTPSVCNRESGTVYVAFDAARRERLLAHQNGNRGFGHQAGCILVITARLDTFLSVGERYQGWIDGGMFAMSVVYALHSLGLGTCCLNWSVEPAADRSLKQEAGIPDDQLVIMMIAVGCLPEHLLVAQSPRRPLTDVLKLL